MSPLFNGTDQDEGSSACQGRPLGGGMFLTLLFFWDRGKNEKVTQISGGGVLRKKKRCFFSGALPKSIEYCKRRGKQHFSRKGQRLRDFESQIAV